MEEFLVRLADELARMRRRLEAMADEYIGLRRRVSRLDGLGEEGTIIGLPPPPPTPTKTDPYDITEMDDEPTRREKRP